ncbi:universal stress protein [Halapricum hydrolyticum]|uniref:Universal stress protein n=1 Tax=Halapricum hydrolyticum TaxID=2979991 RepID=A0AAE3I8L5_9EURY|nr:universal stress protein [Halapricum hydrolyticum]MCU4716685.1 universal stress protein [Halapricum hydrolyticum]MCU4725710.1 universal stress protein [Halapricum hydrolyticum]
MSVNSDECPWPQTLDHRDMEWPSENQRLLVPFREAANQTETSLLGASIAFGTDGELYLLHAVEADSNPDPDELRRDAETRLAIEQQFPVPIVERREEFSPGLLDTFVDACSITSVLVDTEEVSFFSRNGSDQADGLDCHTLVGTGMDEFESPSTILVPVDRGPHSGIATRIAEAIATAYGSRVDLFHVIPEDASEDRKDDATKLLDAYSYRIDDRIDVEYHVLRDADPAAAIIDQSQQHDLTVLGAPEKGKLRRFLFGSTADSVVEGGDGEPVLVAHRNGTESLISRWF